MRDRGAQFWQPDTVDQTLVWCGGLLLPVPPLLDVDISGANSALVNVTGGTDMSIEEAEGVVEEIYERIDPDARIIWGTSVDEELEGSMRTMIVVTGVDSPQIYGRQEEEKQEQSAGQLQDIDYVE